MGPRHRKGSGMGEMILVCILLFIAGCLLLAWFLDHAKFRIVIEHRMEDEK